MKLSKRDKAKIKVLKLARDYIDSEYKRMICLAIWQIEDCFKESDDPDTERTVLEKACSDITEYIYKKLEPFDNSLKEYIRIMTGRERSFSDMKKVRLEWIDAMIEAIETQTEVQCDWD